MLQAMVGVVDFKNGKLLKLFLSQSRLTKLIGNDIHSAVPTVSFGALRSGLFVMVPLAQGHCAITAASCMSVTRNCRHGARPSIFTNVLMASGHRLDSNLYKICRSKPTMFF
jgi:hypothetical protein